MTYQQTEFARQNPDLMLSLPDRPETFTHKDIDTIKHFDGINTIRSLKHKRVVELAEDRGSDDPNLWVVSKKGQAAKDGLERPEDKVMPCDCVRDGFRNVRDGGYECVVCSREFSKEELKI